MFFMGCATYKPLKPSARIPSWQKEIFPYPMNKVYSAAVYSLKDSQFKLAISDPAHGLIESDYREESNPLATIFVGRLQTKIRIQLTPIDSHQTQITGQIILNKLSASGNWEPADLVKPPHYQELFMGIKENCLKGK